MDLPLYNEGVDSNQPLLSHSDSLPYDPHLYRVEVNRPLIHNKELAKPWSFTAERSVCIHRRGAFLIVPTMSHLLVKTQ